MSKHFYQDLRSLIPRLEEVERYCTLSRDYGMDDLSKVEGEVEDLSSSLKELRLAMEECCQSVEDQLNDRIKTTEARGMILQTFRRLLRQKVYEQELSIPNSTVENAPSDNPTPGLYNAYKPKLVAGKPKRHRVNIRDLMPEEPVVPQYKEVVPPPGPTPPPEGKDGETDPEDTGHSNPKNFGDRGRFDWVKSVKLHLNHFWMKIRVLESKWREYFIEVDISGTECQLYVADAASKRVDEGYRTYGQCCVDRTAFYTVDYRVDWFIGQLIINDDMCYIYNLPHKYQGDAVVVGNYPDWWYDYLSLSCVTYSTSNIDLGFTDFVADAPREIYKPLLIRMADGMKKIGSKLKLNLGSSSKQDEPVQRPAFVDIPMDNDEDETYDITIRDGDITSMIYDQLVVYYSYFAIWDLQSVKEIINPNDWIVDNEDGTFTVCSYTRRYLKIYYDLGTRISGVANDAEASEDNPDGLEPETDGVVVSYDAHSGTIDNDQLPNETRDVPLDSVTYLYFVYDSYKDSVIYESTDLYTIQNAAQAYRDMLSSLPGYYESRVQVSRRILSKD